MTKPGPLLLFGLGAFLRTLAEQIGRHRESSSGMDAGRRDQSEACWLRKGVLNFMRKGWRKVRFWSLVFLIGTVGLPALGQNRKVEKELEDLTAITVELRWTAQGNRGPLARLADAEVTLASSAGRVSEAVACPAEAVHSGTCLPHKGEDGVWRLGQGTTGCVRARIEVPAGAELIVRRGEGVVRIPTAALLERPQQTPPQAPLAVSVERLAWDSLKVEFGAGAESGVVAPSSVVPVSLRYNILWPDAQEVIVRTTALLRPMSGEEPVWSDERREVVPANKLDPPEQRWQVPAPRDEGSYVLELSAAWEPAGAREGSRLSRLIHRRKPAPVTNTAARRMVLAVVSPGHPETRPSPGNGKAREIEVDTLDLGRVRSNRFSAWGRSQFSKTSRTVWNLPDEVLQGAREKERDLNAIRRWISRPVAEAASLGPADDAGLAWSAVGLHVSHPDRPHRLVVTVIGGDPSALGLAIVDPGGNGQRARVLLDACASGPPILKDGPPVTFSWLVWPDCPSPLLVALNRNSSGAVRLGSVKLVEVDSLPLSPAARGAATAPSRTVGLYLTGDHALDRFGGKGETGLPDALEVARNLVSYLTACGASLVVLPERLSDRPARRSLQGQADQNATGPDQLDLVLRLLRRQGYSAWLELNLEGTDTLPGLPPADSPEALRQGLVRVDRQGLADGPCYHPLHPLVRQAMKRRVENALAAQSGGAGFSGLLLQLGPGPSLLGSPDTGMDDDTFTRFVHDTFGPETADKVPGLGTTDADRFAARSRYLSGIGRMPWLTWRSRAIASLYAELADSARTASPGAMLALATPVLHGGAVGSESRRVDLAGLAPSQAWRSVGLDLQSWPATPDAPIVLRGIELSTDPLAHDLATSPDLDAKVAAQPRRGFFLTIDPDTADPALGLPPLVSDHESSTPAGPHQAHAAGGANNAGVPVRSVTDGSNSVTLSTLPLGDGAAADEPLGHALAALDAQWVILAAPAIAGHEERLRRYATVLHSLPAWDSQPALAGGNQKDQGVAVRTLGDATQTFLEVANDTPYPIRLAGLLDAPASAAVEDLGRNLRLLPQAVAGGRQLVVDLLPFGVSAIRVGAPKVQFNEITPYPSEAVLTSMEAQYRELSSQLARINRGSGSGAGEPANPGFEPEVDAPVRQAESLPNDRTPPEAPGQIRGGWKILGTSGGKVEIDPSKPHSGQGSLKLTATDAPVAVTSGDFTPSCASSMIIQAYLRAEPADTPVRLWIQGEVGGQPYTRRAEFKVGSSWESKAVRATSLPAGGLDQARLRFELLKPGTLWIDDLHLTGQATPKAVRLNAQRTLWAALQAYRSQHYAEFARLSSSHWARHPSILAVSRSPRHFQDSEVPGSANQGPAEASALSPDLKLR